MESEDDLSFDAHFGGLLALMIFGSSLPALLWGIMILVALPEFFGILTLLCLIVGGCLFLTSIGITIWWLQKRTEYKRRYG